MNKVFNNRKDSIFLCFCVFISNLLLLSMISGRSPTNKLEKFESPSPCHQDHTGSNSGHYSGCSHPELLTVTLVERERGGYGLVLRPPNTTIDPDMAIPVVAALDQDSPAHR